jgi:hypothetical protein
LSQSGTQRDVMGIASPAGRESAVKAKEWLDQPTAPPANPLDFMQRVVPHSAAKAVKGLYEAPYTMGKRMVDPVIQATADYAFGDKAGIPAIASGVGGAVKGAAENVGDIAKFIGTKTGIVAPDESGLNPSINPVTIASRIAHEATTDPVGTGLGLYGAKQIGKPIAKVALKGVGKTVDVLRPADVDKVITDKYEKAVRPSVSGKKTSGQIESAAGKVNRGVKKIVELKDQGVIQLGEEGARIAKVPESLKEFGSAISQGKESVFKQYDTMQREAGEAGAKVTPNPAIKELTDIINDPDVKLANPRAVAHAENWIKRLDERGELTTESAQKVIKSMNTSLDAYYNNPTYDTAVPAYIDSLVANHLRAGLDAAVESAKGPGYQSLKNDYGALKSMEKEVNHRAIVDARKNVKGLIDFSDVFSGAEIAKGILTLDPGSFITGVAARGIRSWYKNLNNPNVQIRKMFNHVDKNWDRGIEKAGFGEGVGTRVPEPAPDITDYEASLRTPGESSPIIERGATPEMPFQYGDREIRPGYTGERPPIETTPHKTPSNLTQAELDQALKDGLLTPDEHQSRIAASEPTPVEPVQEPVVAAAVEPPAPSLPDYKNILDNLTKQTGITRGKGKRNWTDSDFRNWLKQSYPTVAARYAKSDIFKALESQTRGEKLGKHQQRVIDAFNEDHQALIANEQFRIDKKAAQYAAETGMDRTGWTPEDNAKFVDEYEKFKQGQNP